MLIAEIIVSINNANVDKPFSYAVTDEFRQRASRGMRAVVPFGRGNKPVEGFIVDVKEEEAREDIVYKNILSIPDKAPLFNEDLMLLAKWMQDKYYSTLTECIKCILPAGISMKTETLYNLSTVIDIDLSEIEQRIVEFMMDNSPADSKAIMGNIKGISASHISNMSKKGILVKSETTRGKSFIQYEKQIRLKADYFALPKLPKRDTKQGQIISYLEDHGQTALKKIRADLNITDSPINSLAEKGIAEFEVVEIRRKVMESVLAEGSGGLYLTDEQAGALNIILEMQQSENKKPVLIQGVTGSGKTEVYLQAIEAVLKSGKEAIVLVPEISLTPQTVSRFKDRFGERVSVTHSRMSMAERYDQWKNAMEGRISIMIGPRSAIFAPFKNLGIIVIDEEHENTYKSETTPKYDAKLTAIKRAELTNSVVVMGSATPSIESYYSALNNEYILAEMNKRINLTMPAVDIIDMRVELENGNRSIFSVELMEAVRENLERGMQTILFLNRRGHSTYVSCRQCGFVVKCEDCNINYTYHMNGNSLVCHYCGKTVKVPTNCPQCGSKYIKYFGAGTQKIVEEIEKLFPEAVVLRMDMDTTSQKGGHENILSQFKSGRADILVGTQMIAKGLDFPKVTLVGVVAADLSLHTGDYRSAENTFQLLTQVSGRSGRANHAGKVIIQTYNPEHYAIQFSANSDYKNFYELEIALRRQMNYPPYSHVFSILFTGEGEKKVISSLFKLCDIMGKYNKNDDFELIGPAPAVISKIRNRYRWKLLVKAEDETRLKNYVLYCVEKLKIAENMSDINISLTIDPAVTS